MIEQKLMPLLKARDIDALKACITESPSCLRLLLYGQRALIHHAAALGELELIQFMFERKPGLFESITSVFDNQSSLVDFQDANQKSPVRWAAENGHLKVVEYLAEQGANLDLQDKHKQYGPIHFATKNGHEDVVKCLMRYGADVNHCTKNGEGDHPIHLAVKSGHPKLVTLYLERNIALRDLKNGDWYAPIHLAAVYGRVEVMQVLLNAGADIYMPLSGDGGFAALPLHLAAMTGKVDVVEFLLDIAPESLEFSDARGQTAALWALANGHEAVVTLLKARGARFTNLSVEKTVPQKTQIPAEWLLVKSYFEVFAALVLACNQKKIQEVLLLEIATQNEVFECLRHMPRLGLLILENPRLSAFFKDDMRCQVEGDNLRVYSPRLVRRPSFYLEANYKEKTTNIFHESRELGRGAYGIVRLFESKAGGKRAVKSLLSNAANLSPEARKKAGIFLKREANIAYDAYPNDKKFKLFEFFYPMGKESSLYNSRAVQSYVGGESAIRFLMDEPLDALDFAKLTLAIARELKRIHKRGIVHVDFHLGNVMVERKKDDYIVRVIDFGCACVVTDKKPICNLAASAPPEMYSCVSDAPQTAHSSLDVYRFGWALEEFLVREALTKEKPGLQQDVGEKFKCILSFAKAAQSTSPKKRPKLEQFCADLSAEIARQQALSPVEVPSIFF